MSAASKLSCATSETSARSCCARVTLGDIARWKATLARKSSGKTVRPTTASHGSMTIICTMPKTSMTTTPRAIGSGAKMFHVASTSALALDSSWPDGCLWCHDSGRRRYCRVTWRRYIAPRLNIAMPPASRRPMTPVTVTSTTRPRTPPMVHSCCAVTLPAAMAGVIWCSTSHPIVQAVMPVMTP